MLREHWAENQTSDIFYSLLSANIEDLIESHSWTALGFFHPEKEGNVLLNITVMTNCVTYAGSLCCFKVTNKPELAKFKIQSKHR